MFDNGIPVIMFPPGEFEYQFLDFRFQSPVLGLSFSLKFCSITNFRTLILLDFRFSTSGFLFRISDFSFRFLIFLLLFLSSHRYHKASRESFATVALRDHCDCCFLANTQIDHLAHLRCIIDSGYQRIKRFLAVYYGL